jgi:hypothetical protein
LTAIVLRISGVSFIVLCLNTWHSCFVRSAGPLENLEKFIGTPFGCLSQPCSTTLLTNTKNYRIVPSAIGEDTRWQDQVVSVIWLYNPTADPNLLNGLFQWYPCIR